MEMVRFPGGYATPLARNVTFHYYTQDYLGSNRAVYNGTTGAVERQGKPPGPLKGEEVVRRIRFGGKELVTANGLNEYDFGARSYYPSVPGFTSPDPCCEGFPHLSPYLFCGNDPVNNVDPTGMYWVDPEEAEQLKKDINNKISAYQKEISKMKEGMGDGNVNSKIENQISEFTQRVDLLHRSLSDIDLLGNDTQYTYVLSKVEGSGNHTVRLGDDGLVYIETSENALSIHEVAHVRQSKEATGDGTLDFNSEGILKNPGARAKGPSKQNIKIAQAEIEAYRMQFSYDPKSMPKQASGLESIDVHYVGSIRNASGKYVYPAIQRYSNYIKQTLKKGLKIPVP